MRKLVFLIAMFFLTPLFAGDEAQSDEQHVKNNIVPESVSKIEVPDEMGAVVVFRENKFTQRSNDINLYVDDKFISKVKNQSYMVVNLFPKSYKISTDYNSNDPINLDIKVGQISYVKLKINFLGRNPMGAGADVELASQLSDEALSNLKFLSHTTFNQESSTYTLADGSVYDGYVVRGLPHGHGKLKYPEASLRLSYEGNFNYGTPQGYGVITQRNGVTYTGDILDDMAHGKGMAKSSSSSYEGDFFRGMRHGKGIFENADGSKYEGDVRKNKPDGNGKFTRSDDTFIVGEFKEGKLVSGQFYTSSGNLIQSNTQSTAQSNSTATSSDVASFLSDLAIFTLNMTNTILTGYNKGSRGNSSQSLDSELLNFDTPSYKMHQSDFSSAKGNNSVQQPSSVYSSSNKNDSYKSSGCTSDYNCGVGYSCVKKPYSNDGVCMKSVDRNGVNVYNTPSSESIGVKTSDGCRFDTDCPVGFSCDEAYKACVRK